MENEIREMISKSIGLAVGFDPWTDSRKRAYAAVTGTVILDGQLRQFCLDLVRLEKNHTADRLRSRLREVLDRYNALSKAKVVTRDTTSNVTSAFPTFDELLPPGLTNIYRSLRSSDSVDDGVFQALDNFMDIQEELVENCDTLSMAIGSKCVAHIIALIVSDALHQVPNELEVSINKVNTAVKSARESYLVSEQVKHALEKQETNADCLLQDNSTRWWSFSRKVKRCLIISVQDWNEIFALQKLTSLERKELQGLTDMLSILELAERYLEGQS